MCYSHRWKPVAILTVLSLIVSMAAVCLIIESFVFNHQATILNSDMGALTTDIDNFKTQIFNVLVLISVFAFLIGLLGTCCGKSLCKTYLVLPVIYGVSLLGVWIVVIGLGVMI